MTLEFGLGTNSQNLAVRAFIVLLFPGGLWYNEYRKRKVRLAICFWGAKKNLSR